MVDAGRTFVSETALSALGNPFRDIPFRGYTAAPKASAKGLASASSQTNGKHKRERAREGEKWGTNFRIRFWP